MGCGARGMPRLHPHTLTPQVGQPRSGRMVERHESGRKRQDGSTRTEEKAGQRGRASNTRPPNRVLEGADDAGRARAAVPTALQRDMDAHARTIYGLEHHNFDPYEYTCHAGPFARLQYMRTAHKDMPLREAYEHRKANHLLCITARHALKVLQLNMPLQAAVHGWDMVKVLKAVVQAARISATMPRRTKAEAATMVEDMLRDHNIDEHRRDVTAQKDRGPRSTDAIWLLPPAWPPGTDSAWLGDVGLAAMLALARTDLTNRVRRPAEPTDEKGRPVVWLPGQAHYMSQLYTMRAVLNERCKGKTQSIPNEIRKAFRYFSLRADVDETYTVVVEGDLAKLAVQKAREATANEQLTREALGKAAAADEEKEIAKHARGE